MRATIVEDARGLMAIAAARCAIDDIDDAAIFAPLTRLLAALAAEAKLSDDGAIAMRERILRVLCNRLRYLRDWRDHPEIAQEQIVRPVFLTGSGRTGSTKLHKLLAASGDFQWLPFWLGHNPALISGKRDEADDPRISAAREDIERFDAASPEARAIHAFSACEPEEEIQLMEFHLFAPYIFAFASVPSFAAWYAGEPSLPQYEALRDMLRYLQWQRSSGDPRPWVLKSPAHFGLEDVVMDVFPDARLVATHRHPVATIGSGASLITHYLRAYSAEIELAAGSISLTTFGAMSRRHVAVRDRLRGPVFDASYRRVVGDVDRLLEEIYDFLGMQMSPEAVAAMRRWDQDNGQHKLGGHRYDLASFGITDDMVDDASKEYRAAFSAYL